MIGKIAMRFAFAGLFSLAVLAGDASAQVCQIIGAGGAKGSAVCIGTRTDDGTAVFFTAGHCIDRDGVWVAPEGKWIKAQPWAWWAAGPGKDFALVYCAGYKPKAIYSLGSTSPAVGRDVAVCGFAQGGQLTVQKTRVRAHGRGTIDLECRGIQGVSGGPVLVGKTVVGILTHDDIENRCGIATNIETILGALKSWRATPGEQTAAWGVGIGVGSSCGPWGCSPRPFVPMYPVAPAQPYYVAPPQPYAPPQQPYSAAPQTPGYPGFNTDPQTPAPPSEDLTEIRKALGELKTAQAELDLAIAGVRSMKPREGLPGPAGPPGRDGMDGQPGKDADTSAINARLQRLESAEIPVRILDADGKVIDERKYKLGEALEFRLVPRAK